MSNVEDMKQAALRITYLLDTTATNPNIWRGFLEGLHYDMTYHPQFLRISRPWIMIGFARDYCIVELEIPSVDEIETLSAEKKCHKDLMAL